MSPRTKLDDIAKALGVSVATVSNAMSGKGRVSRAMVGVVQKKAKEMGYIPSGAARALRTGRNAVLGLVLADIANPLFPQIAQAIENAAAENGYGILIGDSQGDVNAQTQAINRLIERGADGLIIIPRRGTRIGELGRPVAVIDSPSTPGNTVAADHWNGGVQIGEYLRQNNHTNIVIIGGNQDSNVQNDRVGGLKEGLGSHAQVRVVWVEDIESKHGEGCVLGVTKLASEGVTAFAAVSDLHALRALTELQRAGIRVPDDASVTGFDDLCWAKLVAPAITTMRMYMTQIAKIAVANLIGQIQTGAEVDHAKGKIEPKALCSVPMQLVVRQSSGKAADSAKLTAVHEGKIHQLFQSPKNLNPRNPNPRNQ